MHCERLQPGLFEEPMNVLSSIVFIPVAYLLFRELNKQPHQPIMLKFLVLMVGVIGVGSSLFHMTAQMWAAALADGLPIAITAVTFLYLMSKHVLRFNLAGVLLAAVFFMVANITFKIYFGRGPDGYISLVPTLFILILISIYMLLRKNTSAKYFGLATIIACVALSFRVFDHHLDDNPDLCALIPIGTHWLWHSLMALFFFFTIREVIRKHRDFDKI